jgi:hypothetical protein
MVWQQRSSRRRVFGVAVREVPGWGEGWRTVPLAAAALVLIVASGCVGDSGNRANPAASARQAPTDTASPAPTGKSAVCARALAVQNSVGALTAQDYTEIESAKLAIAQVQQNLRSLRAAASAEFDEEISAVSKSVSELGEAIDNLRGQGTTTEAWQALGEAAGDVGTSAQDLRQSLSSTCPDLRKGLDDEESGGR